MRWRIFIRRISRGFLCSVRGGSYEWRACGCYVFRSCLLFLRCSRGLRRSFLSKENNQRKVAAWSRTFEGICFGRCCAAVRYTMPHFEASLGWYVLGVHRSDGKLIATVQKAGGPYVRTGGPGV
jgi:hypothetical protein